MSYLFVRQGLFRVSSIPAKCYKSLDSIEADQNLESMS